MEFHSIEPELGPDPCQPSGSSAKAQPSRSKTPLGEATSPPASNTRAPIATWPTELQIRLPYSAWGPGEEWQQAHEDLLHELDVALDESGQGDSDDPDHFDDYICFYLDGDDEAGLARVAAGVLERHGLLELATGFVSEDPDDFDTGRVVVLPRP